MAKNASSPGRRFMKLAGMTASIATRSVSNSIRNIRADEEQKQAIFIFKVKKPAGVAG